MKAPASETTVAASQPRVQSSSDSEVAATIGPVWPESYTTTPEQNQLSTLYAPVQPHTLRGTSPGFAHDLRAEPQPLPIRISIGRVDVRAIMPAGTAKAATSVRAKPALSLDNYLKQREEGKR
jgi:hypothetical protein